MQRTFQFWTFYNPLDKTKYSCDFILVDKEILNITVLTSVSPSAVKGPYTDVADKKILVDLKVQGLIRVMTHLTLLIYTNFSISIRRDLLFPADFLLQTTTL